MSFFKRLFENKNTPETRNTVEDHTPALLYPVIHHGSWQMLHTLVRQTLFGTTEAPEVVVTFAYDQPELKYFTYTELDRLSKETSEGVIKKAYENIDLYPYAFIETDTGHGKMLTISGGRFSSEKILSPECMREAQRRLNTDELLVSIPRRTMMYVVDNKCSNELYDYFRNLHLLNFGDHTNTNEPIVNALFLLKNGEIVKYLPIVNKEDFLSDAEITATGEIVDEYEFAKQLYQEEKYPEAKAKLIAIVTKNPGHYEAQNYLAFLYEHKEKNIAKAEEHYLLSLKHGPDYSAANLNYASFLSANGRLDEAEARLKKCNTLNVNQSMLAFEWAYLLEQRQKYDHAIEKYKDYGMLIYDIAELEATLDRIQRCRKKKEIFES